MQVNKFLVLGLSLLFIGCSKSNLSPKEMITWLEDKENGLIKQEIIDGAKYTVTLHPSQYLEARAIIENDSFMLANCNDQNCSIIVKMEPTDNQTQFLKLGVVQKEEPFGRINYYMNGFQNDIKILNGDDTLTVENLIYERLYNVSPAQLILFGFKVKNFNNSIKVIFEDRAINTGKMQFEFSSDVLTSIPRIKI